MRQACCAIISAGLRGAPGTDSALGESGMRKSWWVCLFVGVLVCGAASQFFFQSSSPTESVGVSGSSEQKQSRPLADKDASRPDIDSVHAAFTPDAQKEARLDDTTGS